MSTTNVIIMISSITPSRCNLIPDIMMRYYCSEMLKLHQPSAHNNGNEKGTEQQT